MLGGKGQVIINPFNHIIKHNSDSRFDQIRRAAKSVYNVLLNQFSDVSERGIISKNCFKSGIDKKSKIDIPASYHGF
jgi:hypothetical protein